jgi:hypothetical protein
VCPLGWQCSSSQPELHTHDPACLLHLDPFWVIDSEKTWSCASNRNLQSSKLVSQVVFQMDPLRSQCYSTEVPGRGTPEVI